MGISDWLNSRRINKRISFLLEELNDTEVRTLESEGPTPELISIIAETGLPIYEASKQGALASLAKEELQSIYECRGLSTEQRAKIGRALGYSPGEIQTTHENIEHDFNRPVYFAEHKKNKVETVWLKRNDMASHWLLRLA